MMIYYDMIYYDMIYYDIHNPHSTAGDMHGYAIYSPKKHLRKVLSSNLSNPDLDFDDVFTGILYRLAPWNIVCHRRITRPWFRPAWPV